MKINWGFIAASIVVGLTVAAFLCVPMVKATPCATEDDTWCHWSADTQGNGQGHSFTTYWEGFTVND